MIKVKDNLNGHKYGLLTVISQAEDYISPKGKHRSRWLCKCECGNEIIYYGDSLKNGKAKTCGNVIHKVENLIGQKFGRLTVIKQAKDRVSSSRKHIYWECQCECGNIVEVSRANLKSGKTKSCGCLQKELVAERSKKQNKYDLSGEYGIGWTTNKNNQFYFDLEDYNKIKDYCWYEGGTGYIYNIKKEGNKNKKIYLHHLVKDIASLDYSNEVIDHINGNVYDNRKCNLRIATRSQNNMNRAMSRNNTSGIKGVSFHSTNNKWIVQISKNKQRIYKEFNNKDDAINYRKQIEIELFKDFNRGGDAI